MIFWTTRLLLLSACLDRKLLAFNHVALIVSRHSPQNKDHNKEQIINKLDKMVMRELSAISLSALHA